jgi:Na+/melibiose symporter-like transporter
MGKIDETKEYISTLRTYMAIIGAMLLALGAGLSKLLDEEKIGALFWFGLILGVVFLFLFFLLARATHRDIKKLKDL